MTLSGYSLVARAANPRDNIDRCGAALSNAVIRGVLPRWGSRLATVRNKSTSRQIRYLADGPTPATGLVTATLGKPAIRNFALPIASFTAGNDSDVS